MCRETDLYAEEGQRGRKGEKRSQNRTPTRGRTQRKRDEGDGRRQAGGRLRC